MALPTILFNGTSGGSDTAASGAGPATALSGGNAATVAANNVVTLAVDAPDLSGVATDGSAVIYVNSSSGRKFSKISTVDNVAKTVTCQDNFANTEGTRGWGIGGKRATLAATLTLGVDCYEGWTVTFEDDASLAVSAIYVWNPTLSAADGKLILQGDSVASPRVCVQSSNLSNMSFGTAAMNCFIKNLQFRCSNASRTLANGTVSGVACSIIVQNCIYGDSTNKLNAACARTGGGPIFTFIDCEFKYLITGTSTASSIVTNFIGCWAHNGTNSGFTTGTSTYFNNCLSTANGGDGFNVASGILRGMVNCTAHSNTGDGLDTTGSSTLINAPVINNIFTNNGGYGWNSKANSDNTVGFADCNNYGTGGTANSLGDVLNVSHGPNDLAVDPQYVDTATFNFAVGNNMKAVGYPLSTRNIGQNNSGTKNFSDVGCAQTQGGGGATTMLTGGFQN